MQWDAVVYSVVQHIVWSSLTQDWGIATPWAAPPEHSVTPQYQGGETSWELPHSGSSGVCGGQLGGQGVFFQRHPLALTLPPSLPKRAPKHLVTGGCQGGSGAWWDPSPFPASPKPWDAGIKRFQQGELGLAPSQCSGEGPPLLGCPSEMTPVPGGIPLSLDTGNVPVLEGEQESDNQNMR